MRNKAICRNALAIHRKKDFKNQNESFHTFSQFREINANVSP